jgi:hypothetical protein
MCLFIFSHRQVRQLVAQGGGDEPEDVLAAFNQAATLNWTGRARFLINIADAPAHGRECNDCTQDTYPMGSPTPGCTVEAVMKRLREKSIDLLMMPVKRVSSVHIARRLASPAYILLICCSCVRYA